MDHCRSFDIEILEYRPVESVEAVSHEVDGKNYSFKCTGSGKVMPTRAIIIATSARPDRLGVKGEAELIWKGISYCATCDGALYMDREVAVIGGGDTNYS